MPADPEASDYTRRELLRYTFIYPQVFRRRASSHCYANRINKITYKKFSNLNTVWQYIVYHIISSNYAQYEKNVVNKTSNN